MKYVEALESYTPGPEDLSVFLAGSITDAPDWQTDLVGMLADVDVTLLNPRRKNFPMDDPAAAEAQIKWEFEHLRKADAIVFWFAKETLAPITLFELGTWLMSGKPLFIGVHPEYQRRHDVEIQTKLAKAGRLKVFHNLDDLAKQVRIFADV